MEFYNFVSAFARKGVSLYNTSTQLQATAHMFKMRRSVRDEGEENGRESPAFHLVP